MLRPKPVYRDMAKYKKYAGKVRNPYTRKHSTARERTCIQGFLSQKK